MLKKVLNLLIFLSIVAVGCQNTKNRKDPSPWVADLICNPPCWQNIIPGETTVEELNILLARVPDIDINNIIWREFYRNYSVFIIFYTLDNKVSGGIGIKGNFVKEIYIDGELNLPLRTAILLYGEPNSIVVTRPMGEISSTIINLLYPQSGVILRILQGTRSHSGESWIIEINPEIIINHIAFMEPKEYWNTLTNKDGFFSLIDEDITERKYPWQEYEEIIVYYK